jgi:mannose/fructose/sorbose-specific phosphotransferase system IID component
MVSFGYAILIAIVIGLIYLEGYGYGYWLISRPIFGGALLGLIMGDLKTGLIVGGSVELMYMGVLPIGASIPPNAPMAGLVGTALAILSGGKPEIGIALAVPIGVLVQLLIMLAWNINIFLTHKADKYCEEVNIRRFEMTHLSGLIVFFLVGAIPGFLAVYFGSDLVNSFVKTLPVWFMDGLKVTSAVLPAIGMAMLLRMMDLKKYWSFFLIGFVLAVYLKLTVLPVALLGLGIAAAIFVISSRNNDFVAVDSSSEVAAVNESSVISNTITKKDLLSVFRRSFFTMTSINYERFENVGYNYAMIPVLRKLYPQKEQLKEALLRHNEFFNCHPFPINAILGITIAMEEQRADGKPITAESISATKTALMGPLAGIGDSIFKATFMTLFAAIGASLSLQGNWFGPILFIVPNILLNLFTRYYGLMYGYKLGANLISKIQESDVLNRFVEGANIVGLLVVGVLVVNFVKLDLALAGNIGGAKIVVQDMLNSILPSLLPLSVTLWFYSMLKKKNAIYILIAICFAIGLIGKYFFIFK